MWPGIKQIFFYFIIIFKDNVSVLHGIIQGVKKVGKIIGIKK